MTTKRPLQPATFGIWNVSAKGDISSDEVCYFIPRRDLTRTDWVALIAGKNYLFDKNNFRRAYDYVMGI